MNKIQTVLGSIDSKELGITLPHEHIWCDQRLGPRRDLMGTNRLESTFMLMDDFDLILEELKSFKDQGGGAIVEVTCNGWGRDLDMLARLSAASEIHIIATSGFYIEPHIPIWVSETSVEQLADYITREIEYGIGVDKRKCGVFKSAIHRARVEGVELKVLQAIAIAQQRTGVPITTHTTGGRRMEVPGGVAAVEQWGILKASGVKPERFIAGHVDERPDIDVLEGLGREGCFIQFDVIGKEQYLFDQTRAEIVYELINRGFGNQIMLSHDRNRWYEMRWSGNSGYCHIFEDFLPRLRDLGVTEDQIKAIQVDNPARAFSIF